MAGAQVGAATGNVVTGIANEEGAQVANGVVGGTMAGVAAGDGNAEKVAEAPRPTVVSPAPEVQVPLGSQSGELPTDDALLQQLAKRRASGLYRPRG
jgi:hypothetical protein